MNDFEKALTDNNIKFKTSEPMKLHTTFRIGGEADYYIETETKEELVKAIGLCKKFAQQYIVLGWGSNVLVSDEGIRGVVIRNRSSKIEVLNQTKIKVEINESKEDLDIRHVESKAEERGIYQFSDLDYEENDKDIIQLRLDSGVDLPKAITWTIMNGYTGLQWYSGIPGTIGGAVFNNIHGGTHLFEEVIDSVTLLDSVTEKVKVLSGDEMEFEYDKSIIHKTNDIILDVILNLRLGDKEKALVTAKEWYKRKSIQPRNTPGCVWKNITPQDQEKLGFESNATGYIIDQKLGWRGVKKVGDAMISANHANFIENMGNAKAVDVLKIIKDTKEAVKKEFDLDLHSEIIFLGFKSCDLNEILKEV